MDDINLQKLTLSELLAASEAIPPVSRYDFAQIFTLIHDKYKEAGEDGKAEDMRKEVLIFSLSTMTEKGRFGPRFSGTSDDGKDWSFPDIKGDFTQESIHYYKQRASETDNPILKARYSDVLWELNKSIEHARLAVAAYLESCNIYKTLEWESELADALERSLSISCQIKDTTLINESIKAHYELLEELAATERFRHTSDILESLLTQGKRMADSIEPDRLIGIAQSAIDYYATNETDSFFIQRNFLEIIEKIWRLKGDDKQRLDTLVQIAHSLEEEAAWKKENYPSGNMIAAHFYTQAMQVYLNIGQHAEKVEELKVKIQKCNEAAAKSEYRAISADVEIPRAQIDSYLNFYRNHSSDEIISLIAADPNLIPSYEKTKQSVITQMQNHALLRLFPTSLMKGNICIKRLYEEEEKLDYEIIRSFESGYKLTAILFLKEIFVLLEKQDSDYTAAIEKYLSESLISQERQEIIKHGLRAFAAKDYVSCAHVLVFQIEGTLRDFLGLLGLPTFVYRNNEMRERLLSDIISALTQVEGINKDFLKFIEIYLCDIRGTNYRNDIAHGLLTINAFTQENCLLLLFILIKFASYRIVRPENSESEGGTEA